MKVTVKSFMSFRRELVDAEKSHREWRKARSGLNPFGTVPAAPGAKTYWRLRNGTQGIVRHLQNSMDGLAGIPGHVNSIEFMDQEATLTDEESRLASKWMTEWAELKAVAKNQLS